MNLREKDIFVNYSIALSLQIRRSKAPRKCLKLPTRFLVMLKWSRANIPYGGQEKMGISVCLYCPQSGGKVKLFLKQRSIRMEKQICFVLIL